MAPSNGPIHRKMDDGNGLTGPTLEKKCMMGMFCRTQLMKKMHDGNNLTDPSGGKKEEAGWHRTAVSSSLHLFSF